MRAELPLALKGPELRGPLIGLETSTPCHHYLSPLSSLSRSAHLVMGGQS
jgi:hypothetical protein